jgi:hypothetical protein
MWDRIEDRLALLELLTEGALKRRASQEGAFRWLAELSWTRASSRRDEIVLVAALRSELVALVDRVWPDWRVEHLELLEAGRHRPVAGPPSHLRRPGRANMDAGNHATALLALRSEVADRQARAIPLHVLPEAPAVDRHRLRNAGQ